MMDSLTRMIRDTIQHHSDGESVHSTPTFLAERIAEMLGRTFETEQLSMIDSYSRLAARTIKPDLTTNERLTLAGLGLGGEGGEVIDPIKKHVFHGKPLDREHMIEELGDVLWYVNLAARTLDCPLSDVMTRNIRKLEERHGARIISYGYRLKFPSKLVELPAVEEHCQRGSD